MAGSQTAKTIGVIAAAGHLPLHLAQVLRGRGHGVFIVMLKGIADSAPGDFDHAILPVGALEKIIAVLKEKNCDEVLLAGKFTRPRMKDAIPDALAAKVMAKLLTKGDNVALEMVAEILAEHGITIGDKTAYLDSVRVGEGLLVGNAPDEAVMDSAGYGAQVLEALGEFDVGQSILVQGRRVLAVEAAEGTDAMIARAAALIDPGLTPPVLVKMLKTGQSPHLDPPVIGPVTVESAAKSGIALIAAEADGVLFADREEALALAKQKGIAIFGITRGGATRGGTTSGGALR